MPKKDYFTTEICNVCGKVFEKPTSSGAINCSDCVGNRKKALVRPYTRDTVFLVCKWFGEGMTVESIAELLSRSQDNIRKELERGGVYDVTQKGGVKL